MEKAGKVEDIVGSVIWHQDFNLYKKDNLAELPEEEAVFGIFAVVDDEPVNCRYVSETENLRRTVKDLFENPPGGGMKAFMQGPWVQFLQFVAMPDTSQEERLALATEWIKQYRPGVGADGEYPGYY